MPSELPGLFNKLALEYCSPPSPLAIAENLASWFELDAHQRRRKTWEITSGSSDKESKKHFQSYRRRLHTQSVWKLSGCGGSMGGCSNFEEVHAPSTCHSPTPNPAPLEEGHSQAADWLPRLSWFCIIWLAARRDDAELFLRSLLKKILSFISECKQLWESNEE